MNILQKSEAEKLRRLGKSISEIARTCSVAKSTAYLWTKNVFLPPELRTALVNKQLLAMRAGRKRIAQEGKRRRLEEEKKIYQKAKNKISVLSENEFFFFGLALYWSEGFKKEYSLGLVNSDPYLILLFVQWLFRFGNVQEDEITVRVQINTQYQQSILEIQKRWSKIIHIPLKQFQLPYFQTSKIVRPFDSNYLGLVRIRAKHSRRFFVHILGSLDGLRELKPKKAIRLVAK